MSMGVLSIYMLKAFKIKICLDYMKISNVGCPSVYALLLLVDE